MHRAGRDLRLPSGPTACSEHRHHSSTRTESTGPAWHRRSAGMGHLSGQHVCHGNQWVCSWKGWGNILPVKCHAQRAALHCQLQGRTEGAVGNLLLLCPAGSAARCGSAVCWADVPQWLFHEGRGDGRLGKTTLQKSNAEPSKAGKGNRGRHSMGQCSPEPMGTAKGSSPNGGTAAPKPWGGRGWFCSHTVPHRALGAAKGHRRGVGLEPRLGSTWEVLHVGAWAVCHEVSL